MKKSYLVPVDEVFDRGVVLILVVLKTGADRTCRITLHDKTIEGNSAMNFLFLKRIICNGFLLEYGDLI